MALNTISFLPKSAKKSSEYDFQKDMYLKVEAVHDGVRLPTGQASSNQQLHLARDMCLVLTDTR